MHLTDWLKFFHLQEESGFQDFTFHCPQMYAQHLKIKEFGYHMITLERFSSLNSAVMPHFLRAATACSEQVSLLMWSPAHAHFFPRCLLIREEQSYDHSKKQTTNQQQKKHTKKPLTCEISFRFEQGTALVAKYVLWCCLMLLTSYCGLHSDLM